MQSHPHKKVHKHHGRRTEVQSVQSEHLRLFPSNGYASVPSKNSMRYHKTFKFTNRNVHSVGQHNQLSATQKLDSQQNLNCSIYDQEITRAQTKQTRQLSLKNWTTPLMTVMYWGWEKRGNNANFIRHILKPHRIILQGTLGNWRAKTSC